MGERSNLILEKPENVLAELKDGDNWRYTAQCGVRSETHGQRPGGRMDVEIKVEQPIDPDHPYTITVPVHELSEAVTMFLARLYQLSGLGDGKGTRQPVSEQ